MSFSRDLFFHCIAAYKMLFLLHSQRCCDGGISSNIPRCHDPDVITVSPFSGECDICPQGESYSPHLLHVVDQSLQVSTRNMVRLAKALVPTSWADLEDLFYSGYKDAYRFFKLEGMFFCWPVFLPLPACLSI